MGALACTGLATVGSLTCTGSVQVNGNLFVSGYLNPAAVCWASGKISSTGGTLSSVGASGGFTCTRASGFATGVWHIVFNTAHPIGNGNYSVFLTAQSPAAIAIVRGTTVVPTSTSFDIILESSTFSYIDESFYFMVMDW